jgi:gamma-glutamyltranspeptidase/glutathione hydrolase/leukotriene-C4 hydrolase
MLAWSINYYEKFIRLDPGLSKVFINPDNNQTLKENDIVRYNDLANTLEKIADNGVKEFYDGELSKIIVEENNLNGKYLI